MYNIEKSQLGQSKKTQTFMFNLCVFINVVLIIRLFYTRIYINILLYTRFYLKYIHSLNDEYGEGS